MKTLCMLTLTCLSLSACQGWPARPYSYSPATPLPSRTPFVRTPTPFIVTAASTTPATETAIVTAAAPTPTSPEPTFTPAPAETVSPGAIKADILGCDTGIDIFHGMGEVTNAYVTVSNSTAADEPQVCATLRGLDEARVHPDKTKCLPSLPAGYQVTLKLTVDTTYRKDTPIQVDVSSGDSLVVRAGQSACTAIGPLLPDTGQLGVLQPIPAP